MSSLGDITENDIAGFVYILKRLLLPIWQITNTCHTRRYYMNSIWNMLYLFIWFMPIQLSSNRSGQYLKKLNVFLRAIINALASRYNPRLICLYGGFGPPWFNPALHPRYLSFHLAFVLFPYSLLVVTKFSGLFLLITYPKTFDCMYQTLYDQLRLSLR